MQKLSLTNKYPLHTKYKDSGVEWLGKIPEHWNILKLQRLYQKLKRTGFEKEELLSVYRDRGVIVKSSRSDNHNNASEDLSTYQLVEVDDLAINKMKAWQGSLGVSPHRGIVSPAYYVCRPLSNNDSKFIHYLLRSKLYIKQYEQISGGVRNNQWDLRYEMFRKIEATLPPKEEQGRIAQFLDEQTARIDEIITKKQELIELLKEKRTAVINHAVTRGLDTHAELIDSGIDWIGKVPKGWEVKKLKSGFTFEKGKEAGKFTQEYVSAEQNVGEFPVYSGQTENEGVLGRINSFIYDYPDGVLFSTTVGAKAMTVRLLRNRFSLSQNCVLMVPKNCINPEYFTYLLEIGFLRMRDEIPSHMQPSLRVSDLNKFTVLFPPTEQQAEIANYLREKDELFNFAIAKLNSSVTHLKEFKSSIISHAVTGKINI